MPLEITYFGGRGRKMSLRFEFQSGEVTTYFGDLNIKRSTEQQGAMENSRAILGLT